MKNNRDNLTKKEKELIIITLFSLCLLIDKKKTTEF